MSETTSHCLVCNGHLTPGIPYMSIYNESLSDETSANVGCAHTPPSSQTAFTRSPKDASNRKLLQLRGRLESALQISLTRVMCHSPYICAACEDKLSEVEQYYRIVCEFRQSFLKTAHVHGIEDSDIAARLTSTGFSGQFLQQQSSVSRNSFSLCCALRSPGLIESAANDLNALKNGNSEPAELALEKGTMQTHLVQQVRSGSRGCTYPPKSVQRTNTKDRATTETPQHAMQVAPSPTADNEGTMEMEEEDNYGELNADASSLTSRPGKILIHEPYDSCKLFQKPIELDEQCQKALPGQVSSEGKNVHTTPADVRGTLSNWHALPQDKDQLTPKSDSWEENFKNYGKLVSQIHPINDNMAGQVLTIDKHMVESDKAKGNICKVCGKAFKLKRTLKSHTMSHWTERKHVCHICNRGFHTEAYLERHKKRIHSDSEGTSCGKLMRRNQQFMTLDRLEKRCASEESFPHRQELPTHLLVHVVKHDNEGGASWRLRPRGPEANVGVNSEGMQGAEVECGSKGLNKMVDIKEEFIRELEQNLSEIGETDIQSSDGEENNCSREDHTKLVEGMVESEEQDKAGDIKANDDVLLDNTEKEDSVPVFKKKFRYSMDRPHICVTCGKGYKTKSVLHVHMKTHKTESAYACSACGKRFLMRDYMRRHMMRCRLLKSSKELFVQQKKEQKQQMCTKCGVSVPNLNRHMQSHAAEDMHTCTVCNKEFHSALGLKLHIMKHTQQWPLSCDVCGKGFSTKSRINAHMQVHTGERPHCCETCGRRFVRKALLEAHMFEHTGRWPLVCSKCGKGFAIERTYNQHQLVHSGECPFPCDQCEKGFKTKVQLKIHLMAHSGERRHVCIVCGKGFLTKAVLMRHVRIHAVGCGFDCSICNKNFTTVDYLRKHVENVHTAECRHVCTQCRKSFKSKGTLKLHMTMHDSNITHICSVCGKRFALEQYLRVHMMGHTGERPHLCSTCGKGFKTAQVLKIHTLTHGAGLPHKCDMCGKSFKSRDYLNKHMMYHSNERPYKCAVCEKRFKTNVNLTIHKAVHTGEHPKRAHQCKYCGKLIYGSMSRHMAIHTGDWPVQCSICGKGAQSIWHIQKHIRSMHPGEDGTAISASKTVVKA